MVGEGTLNVLTMSQDVHVRSPVTPHAAEQKEVRAWKRSGCTLPTLACRGRMMTSVSSERSTENEGLRGMRFDMKQSESRPRCRRNVSGTSCSKSVHPAQPLQAAIATTNDGPSLAANSRGVVRFRTCI
jgi:hypothetical protein